jgi:hypothetical protein
VVTNVEGGKCYIHLETTIINQAKKIWLQMQQDGTKDWHAEDKCGSTVLQNVLLVYHTV